MWRLFTAQQQNYGVNNSHSFRQHTLNTHTRTNPQKRGGAVRVFVGNRRVDARVASWPLTQGSGRRGLCREPAATRGSSKLMEKAVESVMKASSRRVITEVMVLTTPGCFFESSLLNVFLILIISESVLGKVLQWLFGSQVHRLFLWYFYFLYKKANSLSLQVCLPLLLIFSTKKT